MTSRGPGARVTTTVDDLKSNGGVLNGDNIVFMNDFISEFSYLDSMLITADCSEKVRKTVPIL